MPLVVRRDPDMALRQIGIGKLKCGRQPEKHASGERQRRAKDQNRHLIAVPMEASLGKGYGGSHPAIIFTSAPARKMPATALPQKRQQQRFCEQQARDSAAASAYRCPDRQFLPALGSPCEQRGIETFAQPMSNAISPTPPNSNLRVAPIRLPIQSF